MPRYGAEVSMDPKRAVDQAVAFFSPDSIGLEVTEHSECCAHLIGGGGHVRITATGRETATLDLETREWDRQVRQVLRAIG
jgi:hypothetical protein